MNNLTPEYQDVYLKKIEKQIRWSIFIAILLIALVLISYFLHFNGGFHKDQDKWGTFGDFVGGTLNPVLAALAFYWLTSSIRLQIQELRDTRGVLEETASHQREIATLEGKNVQTQQQILELQTASLTKQLQTAEQQQQQIAIQNFENIFFELLKTKNDAIQDISFHTKKSSLNSATGFEFIKISGKDAISRHLRAFKETDYGKWEDYYNNNLINSFSSYFRICYQIVRLIDDNTTLASLERFKNKDYSIKQKQYFDIFKATLQQSELEALFYNCLYNYRTYKKILEKYGIFEPLVNMGSEKSLRFIKEHAYMYDISAFDRNKYFLKYFEEIRKIDLNLNSINVYSSISFLEKQGLITVFYPDGVTKKLGGKEFPIEYSDFYNLVLMKIKLYKKTISDYELALKVCEDINELKIIKRNVEDLNNQVKILAEIDCLESIFYLVKYSIDFNEYIGFNKDKLTS
ncbi:hypothetical protein IIQ43_18160 [Acinetobacter oleivorans]|uniref:Phage abortive infection protein n=1 Tax=Acinetobacter oleivorans TaxID=1148157 RepID=A0ABR9NP28_9GAMM|nr:putative phage abortive infection protein [Acinetobacter oleivorans]MBE2166447.1 hypothetical protein [Acinetobacter oleivorans]